MNIFTVGVCWFLYGGGVRVRGGVRVCVWVCWGVWGCVCVCVLLILGELPHWPPAGWSLA